MDCIRIWNSVACSHIFTFCMAGTLRLLFCTLAKSKPIDSKKIWLLAVTTIITFTLTLIPLRELFLTRTTTPTTIMESSLTERIWLAQQAWTYAKENP